MRWQQASIPRKFLLDVLGTPDLVARSLRTAVRRRVTAPLEYTLGDGHSRPLTQVDLKLTNACDLRCKMCGQWGESGWHLSQPTSFLRETVSLDTYKGMVDDVKRWSPWMFIYGGEPLLYHDLLPLTAYMKEQGLLVTIVTNGGRLEQLSDPLVTQQVDFVMVSIDGPRDIHDAIRGRRGSYDRAVAGLTAVQEHKRQRGLKKPFTVVVVTVSKHNTADLDQVFELAESVGVDALIGYYGYFQTEESCRRHEETMERRLGTRPKSPRGWLWSHTEIDAGVLVSTLERIRARRWRFAYVFAPELKDEEIALYYQDHSRTFGYNRCVAPWMMITVLPNGDVAPCRDYPDHVVGNITQTRLTELWNCDRLRQFRTVLKDEGLLPICSRCCGLMDL